MDECKPLGSGGGGGGGGGVTPTTTPILYGGDVIGNGRGLHSFTSGLNLSNSWTLLWGKLGCRADQRAQVT